MLIFFILFLVLRRLIPILHILDLLVSLYLISLSWINIRTFNYLFKSSKGDVETIKEGWNKILTMCKFIGGSTSPLFDFRKKAILEDGINIKQWEINMKYINLCIRYSGIPDFLFSVSDEDRLVSEGATYEVKSCCLSLVSPTRLMDIPEFLREIEPQKIAWFIAAYPDVFQFYYPSSIKTPNSIDEKFEAREYSSLQDSSNGDKVTIRLFKKILGLKSNNELEKFISSDKNKLKITNMIDKFLLLLKDEYQKETGKKFILSNI